MPKIKGGKTSVKKLKQRTSRQDTGLIWSIKEDKDLTVRFLDEPDEWFGYEEYWDDDAKMYVPVSEGDEVPVDDKGRTTARLKYLASAVLLDNDRVVALKMPKSLANVLLSRYDKFGTIMDREYELVRSGTGLDTKYDAVNEGPSKFKFSKYESLDLGEILEGEWLKANPDEAGYDDDDDDDDPRPVKKKDKKKSKKKSKKKKSKGKGRKRGTQEDEPEEDEYDDEEEESYEEDELLAMKLPELRAIGKEYGIKTAGIRKADLVELIMEEQPF